MTAPRKTYGEVYLEKRMKNPEFAEEYAKSRAEIDKYDRAVREKTAAETRGKVKVAAKG